MAARLELAVRNTDRVVSLASGQSVTLGRTAQCDVQLDDPSVSRRHCTIACTDGLLQVTDLDSANGTFINERPITESPARPGDVIRLGAAILDVRDPSGLTRRPDETFFVDSSAVESVIQRRIEPSSFEWLAPSGEGTAPELALLKRAERHLSTLHRVSEALSGARDIQRLADVALRAILEVLSADRAALVLRRADAATGEIEMLAARSKTQSMERFAVSRTLVSSVIADGVSVFAHDASSDARFSEGQSVIGQRVRSVMCVPLRTTDEILGALYVDSLSGAGRFNESDLELLAAIGNQAGVAMHRVRLISELERLLLDTIKAITATIDARDGYTRRHSERVAALTAQLGLELGLDESERQTAELSALLHDVGKIAVPDSILNKPGKLTRKEFAEMQKHPVHGAQILGNIQSATVKAVLPGVRSHHEKWDGTGYPDGLAAEAIPFLGRLLGVADVFDALTSTRSYRGAMTPDQAIKLIGDGAGRHFDPVIAAAAVRLFERGEFSADALPSDVRRVQPSQDIAGAIARPIAPPIAPPIE
jgi:HD-GYP domain-containing protein (c-di-GMP phosphodiesterase class II)